MFLVHNVDIGKFGRCRWELQAKLESTGHSWLDRVSMSFQNKANIQTWKLPATTNGCIVDVWLELP